MESEPVRINDSRIVGVETVENGEQMVDLREYVNFMLPSEVKGIENTDTWFDPVSTLVRLSVAERLKIANKKLQELRPGTKMAFTETYRPYDVQKNLYEERLARIKEEKPGLSVDEYEKLVTESVSNPDRYSPHVTGGCVDLTLVDASGMRLDMGIKAGYGPWDRSDYVDLTYEQRQNRELLAKIMGGAGFVNYPYEWWHWSYGDKYWGYVTRNPAIYEPVKGIRQ